MTVVGEVEWSSAKHSSITAGMSKIDPGILRLSGVGIIPLLLSGWGIFLVVVVCSHQRGALFSSS